MKRILPVFVIAAAWYLYQGAATPEPGPGPDAPPAASAGETPPDAAVSTPAARDPALIPGHQASGSGTVIRVLPDDNDGSRHQRFILRLASGKTLLVAHNIDVAPRVSGIREGDRVEFSGEFQSNPQGGVIHWTHHDPAGRHPDGWLRHRGRTYE